MHTMSSQATWAETNGKDALIDAHLVSQNVEQQSAKTIEEVAQIAAYVDPITKSCRSGVPMRTLQAPRRRGDLERGADTI